MLMFVVVFVFTLLFTFAYGFTCTCTVQAGEANDCVFTGWVDFGFLKVSGRGGGSSSEPSYCLVFGLRISWFLKSQI